jgi:hypothetical protein
MNSQYLKNLAAIALCLGLASVCGAQSGTPGAADPAATATPAPAAPPAPAALPTPSITGPLQGLPPAIFEAGPFGKIAVNGIVNGMGMWTGNYIPGDNPTQLTLSNGQVFIQKTDGWFQFYVQAGVYNLPALGTPFLATDKTNSNFFGPVPQAFLKLQAGKNTSFEIGALPTLIGAEYTFTFENMNIQRGLLSWRRRSMPEGWNWRVTPSRWSSGSVASPKPGAAFSPSRPTAY